MGFLIFFQYGSAFFRLFQFLKNAVIDYLDIGAFHTGRTGFDHTCTLEFSQGIDDDGTGNACFICNTACYSSVTDRVMIADCTICCLRISSAFSS